LNEESEAKPTDERGKILLEAEDKFLGFNEDTTIIRFSGIYGRSNYFLNQLKKGTEIQKEPPYYTNRVHRSDCVGVLAFIANRKSEGKLMSGVYIASDNDPASKWDVANFLANVFNVNKPKAQTLDETANQNKRLDNKRLLQEGYEFKYSSYIEGYTERLDE
jgi:nucleoside-diphosphate-sugar epimerase